MSDADTTLLTSLVEVRDEPSTGGIGFVTVKLSGEPWANALTQAVIANYNRITGRPKPSLEQLQTLMSPIKVTLILGGGNMMGSSTIIAREGRLFEGSRGGLAILPKGKRSNGFVVDPGKVLDVLPGWEAGEAGALIDTVVDQYPNLINLTQERLDELPRQSQTCSMALFGTNPTFGGADCIWLIGEYWPDDDICDTNVLLIRPEFGISEHGSCYGRDLLHNRALGEIVGFEPISFKEANELCFLDFDDAAKRVLG